MKAKRIYKKKEQKNLSARFHAKIHYVGEAREKGYVPKFSEPRIYQRESCPTRRLRFFWTTVGYKS